MGEQFIRPKLVLKTSDPSKALQEGDLDAVREQPWMSEGKEPELASGFSGFLLVCVISVLVLVLVVSVIVLCNFTIYREFKLIKFWNWEENCYWQPEKDLFGPTQITIMFFSVTFARFTLS